MNKNYFYRPYQATHPLRKMPCPVCAGEGEKLIAVENGLRIVSCDSCGYVFVNPRPDTDDLKLFYQEYYPDQDGLPDSWGGEMRRIFIDAYEKLAAQFDGGKILDIGSSYGHFLCQFDPAKWQATGIDPSPNAIGYSRTHYPHIQTHVANFEDVEFEPESFNVITSFYVLEHVFDPAAMMRSVHGLLTKGGVAVIRIPYTKPFFRIAKALGRPLMYAPMHLNDFSPAHFQRMCREIGFDDVTCALGARRESSDFVENAGALTFSLIGSLFEKLTFSSVQYPFAGAYSYTLRK
ncbi:MAG: class I SAM-dependent methyltransferase [Pseudomonadota bacterium]